MKAEIRKTQNLLQKLVALDKLNKKRNKKEHASEQSTTHSGSKRRGDSHNAVARAQHKEEATHSNERRGGRNTVVVEVEARLHRKEAFGKVGKPDLRVGNVNTAVALPDF